MQRGWPWHGHAERSRERRVPGCRWHPRGYLSARSMSGRNTAGWIAPTVPCPFIGIVNNMIATPRREGRRRTVDRGPGVNEPDVGHGHRVASGDPRARTSGPAPSRRRSRPAAARHSLDSTAGSPDRRPASNHRPLMPTVPHPASRQRDRWEAAMKGAAWSPRSAPARGTFVVISRGAADRDRRRGPLRPDAGAGPVGPSIRIPTFDPVPPGGQPGDVGRRCASPRTQGPPAGTTPAGRPSLN
jgi:hypothetical protein